jgi:hypothetical protein
MDFHQLCREPVGRPWSCFRPAGVFWTLSDQKSGIWNRSEVPDFFGLALLW